MQLAQMVTRAYLQKQGDLTGVTMSNVNKARASNMVPDGAGRGRLGGRATQTAGYQGLPGVLYKPVTNCLFLMS
jgi:hypothetical protein